MFSPNTLRAILASEGLIAASKLDYITVQGYKGFTDQIRQLDELDTEARELAAQIDAAVRPLLDRKSVLDKKMKIIHGTIKKDYKESLTAVGNITIDRKTKLVEARATLKVTTAKANLNQVQADLLAAVVEKYGAEVAKFISETQAELQESKRSLRVAFKGFEIEHKADTRAASARTAGFKDLLDTFQNFLTKTWKKMVGAAKSLVANTEKSSARVDKAHTDFIDTLDELAREAVNS